MNAKLFKLAKMILNLASVATDRGELNYDGALEIGTEVFVANEAGDFVPAEDGEYITEDNTVIVVAEGKVTEIKPAEEVIETPALEPENEPEHVQEVLETEEPEQEPESAEQEQDEKDLKIAELETRIAELEAENAELKAKLDEASAKEAELSAKLKMSAEESAAKRAKKETKPIVKRSQYI